MNSRVMINSLIKYFLWQLKLYNFQKDLGEKRLYKKINNKI